MDTEKKYDKVIDESKTSESEYMTQYENKYGKLTGYIKFKTPNGSIYEGDYVNGDLHGQGKATHSDGTVYKGEWKNGLQHGKGKHTESVEVTNVTEEWQVTTVNEMFQKKSYEYQGEWKKGQQHGMGKFIWTDGSIYEGRHEHGERVEGTIKQGTLKITGQIKTIDNRTAENSYKDDVELIVTDTDGHKTKFKYGLEIKGLILIG